MPKLKPSEAELKNRITTGYIAQKQLLYDISDMQLAKALDLNKQVFQRKKKHDPESFRLWQIRTLAKLLHFEDEEKAKMI